MHLISLFFSVALLFFPQVSNAAFGGYQGQRPGMMNMMNNNMNNANNASFKKEQNGQIDDITQEILKFTQWLDTTGLLEYYDHLKDDYNANKDIENKYSDYIKSTNTSIIKAPAGYRLPKYRYAFTPLSEVLNKYSQVMDILDDGKRAANAAARSIVDARRIVELTDWIRDYAKKYNDETASFDIKASIDKAQADVKVVRNRIDNVRASLELYLDQMGISLDELRKNPNDMKDMAQDVEKLIKELNEDPLVINIQKRVVQQYSGTFDPANTPFVFPLNDPTKTTFVDLSFEEINEKVTDLRIRLFSLDSNIRGQAMQTGNIGTDLTPLAPKQYFTDRYIPPSLDEMQNSTLVHEYMFDGYLGYWLQNIVNVLHEIKLAGLDIMINRLALKNIATTIDANYLSILTSMAPAAVQTMPIITDHTADEIDILTLKTTEFISKDTFVTKYKNDYTPEMQEVKKKIVLLQKATPLIFSLYEQGPPLRIAVPEVLNLHRTLLLTSLAHALCTGQLFSPATYKESPLGLVPASIWPRITAAVA